MTNNDIFKYLCSVAPLNLQLDFDNSGFLIGDLSKTASSVLLSLDITENVIDEAINKGCSLIITHHPVIFKKVSSITTASAQGRNITKLINNGISVISMHTNLDITDGGVNDVLMDLLGGVSDGSLDDFGCGRIGKLAEPLDFDSFLSVCKEKLHANGLRYYKASDNVSRIAVLGGSGGDEIELAFNKGCDTYITSDIKYHQFIEAAEFGMNLIDADHFCTENPVIGMLKNKLADHFENINFIVSDTHNQIISFY